MTNYLAGQTGHKAFDEPGRGAEVKTENAALHAQARCTRCGDTLGQGLTCVECAKARLAANQPKARGMASLRPPPRTAGTGNPPDGKTQTPRMRGDHEPGAEEREMAKVHKCASGCGEAVPREGDYCAGCRAIGDGGGRKPQAAGGGRYRCRNPLNNPKCSGTTGRDGGLCRSCGIRAGKRRGEPPAKPGGRASDAPPAKPEGRAPAAPALATGLPATVASAAMAGVPVVVKPAAGEGPGPLTMALCDFFAEAAKVSKRVEASLVMEDRVLEVNVKFKLP